MEKVLFGKVTDTNDGIKIMPSETSIVPPEIKAIWEEADNRKISIKEIVETVKKERNKVYDEEY